MATETIGIPIDITKGIFNNVENGTNGLQLSYVGETYDGITQTYSKQGFWESEVTSLGGGYTSLENLTITDLVSGSSIYTAYTRTSDDGITWDSYIEIDSTTGKMMSVPRQYIQVKIEFTGSTSDYQEVQNDFNDGSEFQDNEFVEFDGNMQLKKDYSYKSQIDNTWTDEGNLFRKTIIRSNWKKIDSIDTY